MQAFISYVNTKVWKASKSNSFNQLCSILWKYKVLFSQRKHHVLHAGHFYRWCKHWVHDGPLTPRAALSSVGDESSPSQHVLRLPRRLTQHWHRHTWTAHDNYNAGHFYKFNLTFMCECPNFDLYYMFKKLALELNIYYFAKPFAELVTAFFNWKEKFISV